MQMTVNILGWFLISLMFINTPACAVNLPTAMVTLNVVDEKGAPIQGAKASITFAGIRPIKGGIDDIAVKGLTDSSGMFSASKSTTNEIAYGVEIADYYRSEGVYRFHSKEGDKWQPWNHEIKVVMRKKEKPVPMYAQDLKMTHPNIVVPVVGKPAGFDLIEYDWVSPYGKGKHSDFICQLDRRFVNDNDFDAHLTITFPNKFDGIQVIKDNRKGGSVFKLPRYAPEEGYQYKLTRFMRGKGVGVIESDSKDDNNYIFRVRSEVKDGKLIRAMYGKIQGDIEIEPRGSKTAVLLFKYFLNPDYTRNLEYGKNLFPGVQVGID